MKMSRRPKRMPHLHATGLSVGFFFGRRSEGGGEAETIGEETPRSKGDWGA